ncbi:MAG: glutamine-hydrolyzing GMP synthase [Verrucomicrobiota bacterium]|nr:glutamine-hydrolyzing GMP synthase [Verrucomicrobiota bacterium]
MSDRIIILDFGSQYTQVIARRVREAHVYSEILKYNTSAKKIAGMNPSGIILSGGPSSVYSENAPMPDPEIFNLGVPILGICYGLQIMAKFLGGKVARGTKREYGKGTLTVKSASALFKGLPKKLQVWNSHGDKLVKLPKDFKIIAQTDNCEYAGLELKGKNFFGIQFHPEVSHTPLGKKILSNFILSICGAKPSWTMKSYIEQSIAQIRETVGKDRVILGLSGGVDSSVAAALIHKAIGKQMVAIFVNNGLLRKNEDKIVQTVFRKNFRVNLKYVDATNVFLSKLRGVTEPEAKRKIIGNEFVYVFQRAMKQVGHAKFLAQGTLYPDVIESVPICGNPAAKIKSHHNVGGLPKDMKFKLLEPLRCLFKDEVRKVGEELGLPPEIVNRHPFPGPGLGVRVLGPLTRERIAITREADAIVIDEMKKSGWYQKVWQAFAVLLPVKSVGVMGDERTYAETVAVRIVESSDGMTADWVHLPHDLLGTISSRIINEVKGVNRCVYDITSKPPGTIEWE